MQMLEEGVSRRSFLLGGLATLGVAGAAMSMSGCSNDSVGVGGDKRYLSVGAAHTTITIPESKFPLSENDTQAGDSGAGHSDGEYDMLHEGHDLRFGLVLIDDGDAKYALIDIDHVNPQSTDIANTKALVQELCGVAPENQWFHNPHVLSCPHFIDWEDIEPAVQEACESALANKKQATFGYGEGTTTINVNRCYKTANGWQQISNWHGNTDHTLPVMRFDDENGNPIAILYVVNTAAGVLENAMNSTKEYADGTTGKTRQVSCDIAGLSSRYIEAYYGNDCVALYFCGCTGDQWCETRAENNYLTMSPKDDIEYVEKTYLPIDAQFTLLDIVSSRLGYAVIDTANEIQCDQVSHVVMKNNKVSYPRLDKEASQLEEAPFEYVQSTDEPEIETDITVFAIDDVAVTGVKTEMNIQTLKDIREQSPFEHNMLHGWVSFDENSAEGYLPDQEGFDQSGKQAGKTSFMPGSAEMLVENAIELLEEVHY